MGELPEGVEPAWGQALYDVHVQISGALRAGGDATLHAYDAGRSLAELCQHPKDLSELMDRLESSKVIPIQGRLADLASCCPPIPPPRCQRRLSSGGGGRPTHALART